MAINDIWQATAFFSVPGADGAVVNVWHFRQSLINFVTTEIGYAGELSSELEQQIRTLYMPFAPVDIEFDRVDIFNVNQPTIEFSFPSNTFGSIAGERLGPRSAPVISKRTGSRGRSFRGRMFLLPPAESQSAAGSITTVFQTQLQTFVDACVVLVIPNGNEYHWSVFSQKLLLGTDVQTLTVRSQYGSIRGRKKVST